MKVFNKKFKTKVVYFSRDKYRVLWAYYRFIPTWHEIKFWFQQTLTGGTECWTTRLFSVYDAEELARSLKSKKDVEKYYKVDEEKKRIFYKRKKEYCKRAIPYQSKEF